MQLLSATVKLSEAMFDCPSSFAASGQHILRCTWDAVIAWFSSTFGADLLQVLVVHGVLCAGVWLVRSAAVQGLIQQLLSITTCDSDATCKKSAAVAITSSTCAAEDLGWSNPSGKHGHFQKPSINTKLRPKAEDCRIGRRVRCSALRAQTGGQPPELPKACTTVILRHIPKCHTPDVVLASLHESGYFGEIDFIYVPIDFKQGDCSLGFAILNFRETSACVQFVSEFHLADASNKIASDEPKKQLPLEVSPAQIQGFQDNVSHLQKSSVLAWLTRHPVWLPRVVDGGGLSMPLKALRSRTRPRRLPLSREAK